MIVTLVIADEEGNYNFNKVKGQSLVDKFDSWKGTNIETVDGDVAFRELTNKVKNDKSVNFSASGLK
jgi:hypothetical protein